MTSDVIEAAWQAWARAYAPYSSFQVGAALVAQDGRIFTGCNVENLSYGLTICAERNAVSSAVAAGAREFSRIVVVADTREPISPCGACRQVLAEFGDAGLEVRSRTPGGVEKAWRLGELLPHAFTKSFF